MIFSRISKTLSCIIQGEQNKTNAERGLKRLAPHLFQKFLLMRGQIHRKLDIIGQYQITIRTIRFLIPFSLKRAFVPF